MSNFTFPSSGPNYSFGGNGVLYSSFNVQNRNLGRFLDGDRVGILIDATMSPPNIAFHFYVNGEPRGQRYTATGTFFPCIGLWHASMSITIVVAPQWPDENTYKQALAS